MSVLLYGSSSAPAGTYERAVHDGFVPWVIKRIPHMARVGAASFGPAIVFVVASSPEPRARILAAVVFHGFHAGYRTMEVSMASDTPLWAKPRHISTMLRYVFDTAGCKRLQAVVPRRGAGPRRTNRFLKHIGFKFEGIGRCGFGTNDAVMLSMLREDAARWLPQEGASDARAA